MEIKRHLTTLALLTGLIALSLIQSCKKDAINNTTSYPVIEGYLYPGHPLTIKLYQQKALADTANYGAPITGLQLSVSDGSSTVKLTEGVKGTYTYNDSAYFASGKTYSLSFTYLSTSVSASTVVPVKALNFATQYVNVHVTPATGTPNTKPDTINRFTWDNPDSLNHVLVFKNSDASSFPLNNRGISQNYNFQINTNQRSVYYVTPNIFPYYGHYKVILLSVNQEYIDLLKSNTARATSQNLVNTPTNIVNGYGIFTAAQADTLSFNVLN